MCSARHVLLLMFKYIYIYIYICVYVSKPYLLAAAGHGPPFPEGVHRHFDTFNVGSNEICIMY